MTDTMCRGRVSAVHSVGNVLYHHATGQGPEVQLTLAGRGLDESPQRSACKTGVERSPHSDEKCGRGRQEFGARSAAGDR